MKNLFNSVKMFQPRYNYFDLSHDFKFSANMGELIPIMCLDCVPGDKVTISAESLIRLAPMLAPMMHRVDVTIHYFSVPKRLLWNNWENFRTNTKVAGVIPAFPTITMASGSYTRLKDYMGIPPITGANSYDVNALPFAAYQKIYNEYYRDQNVTAEVIDTCADGNNVVTARLMKRGAGPLRKERQPPHTHKKATPLSRSWFGLPRYFGM